VHRLFGDRLVGVVVTVVPGLGLRWWPAAEAVHEPARVVQVHPGGGCEFEVGDGVQAGVKRGAGWSAFGLVQADGGFGAGGVVVGVADAADRGLDAGLGQVVAEGDGGVLGSRRRSVAKSTSELVTDHVGCGLDR
jgi:hypothetical protein